MTITFLPHDIWRERGGELCEILSTTCTEEHGRPIVTRCLSDGMPDMHLTAAGRYMLDTRHEHLLDLVERVGSVWRKPPSRWARIARALKGLVP